MHVYIMFCDNKGIALAITFVQSMIFLLIAMLIFRRHFAKRVHSQNRTDDSYYEHELQMISDRTEMATFNNTTKVYGQKVKKFALNRLNLVVNAGECLGVLGELMCVVVLN